jgi:hypothetical protein
LPIGGLLTALQSRLDALKSVMPSSQTCLGFDGFADKSPLSNAKERLCQGMASASSKTLAAGGWR